MTMIPNKYTRPFGCENLHAVIFQSCADRGGVSPAVVIMIPEEVDKLTESLKQAHKLRARLLLLCDTEEQAAVAKQVALDILPDHREVSLSRAEAGAWGLN